MSRRKTYTQNCKHGCCSLKYQIFNGIIDHGRDKQKYKKMKGGGILHDIKQDKILIVQSRGKFWGLPKGTKNINEKIENCAIREIKEETGIEISQDNLEEVITINRGKSKFYYIPYEEKYVEVQNSIENNDANGIGWIKLKCLTTLLKDGVIKMNRQSKIAIQSKFYMS